MSEPPLPGVLHEIRTAHPYTVVVGGAILSGGPGNL